MNTCSLILTPGQSFTPSPFRGSEPPASLQACGVSPLFSLSQRRGETSVTRGSCLHRLGRQQPVNTQYLRDSTKPGPHNRLSRPTRLGRRMGSKARVSNDSLRWEDRQHQTPKRRAAGSRKAYMLWLYPQQQVGVPNMTLSKMADLINLYF